jgi:hypothetical protein
VLPLLLLAQHLNRDARAGSILVLIKVILYLVEARFCVQAVKVIWCVFGSVVCLAARK